MGISKEFIVNLKGRDYPIFAGVLDAAHKAGLQSLTTALLQIPSAENGMVAIVQATATFADGRTFSDVGDCSPATTSPSLAAASIRLASTRAKGRVLRDAVNVGQALLEEMPDLDDAPEPPRNGHRPQAQAQQRNGTPNGSSVAHSPQTRPNVAPSAPQAEAPAMTCSEDGKTLTKGQYEVSLRAFGKPMCPGCQKAAAGRN